MPKITDIPLAGPLTGAELVPVVQDDATALTTLGALVESVAQPFVDAAATEADRAAAGVGAITGFFGDALSTGEFDVVHETVGAVNTATLSSNVGVQQVGLINGTHISTGQVIKALRWAWACASTTASVEIKVWKRDVAGATGAGTINNAAPVATHDTLLATFSTTPAALGVTAGASNPVQTNIFALPSAITVEAGFDLMFQFRNLDAGSAVVNCGFMYFAVAAGTQRRAGFQALTASPTTFTSLTTTRTPAITVFKARQKSTLPAADAALRKLVDQRDSETLAAMNQRNVNNLLASAAIYPNALAVPAPFWGDSLTFDNTGTGDPGAGYKATEVVDGVTSGTISNYGINGETSAQIAARVVAASAGDKAGFNQVQMGTNDYAGATTAAATLTNFATCAAAFTNASFVMAAGWTSGNFANSLLARKAFDVRAGLKSAYGAKALDMHGLFARYGTGAGDWLAARRGNVPTDLTQDGVHQNKAGGLVKGYCWAAHTIARNGGAPFVHDDIFGFKAGDASGTAIGTVRTLGTALNYQIIAGNADRAVQINRLTGAITRTAEPVIQPYREVFVEAENNKGLGRNGRIIMVQQMDGTRPEKGVAIKGNGASFMNTPSAPAVTDGTEMTIVICARLNPARTSGYIVSTGGSFFAGQTTNGGIQFAGRGSNGNTSLGAVTAVAQAPSEWNFYFFTIKTDAAICAAVANERTAVTAVPTSGATVYGSLISAFFTNLGDTLPFIGDIKMVWVASQYLDITDSAVRANFYDSTTREPKDIGSAGTVGGVTPIYYLRGMAGDYLLGKNFGSVGDLHAPVPLGAAHLGFTDIET